MKNEMIWINTDKMTIPAVLHPVTEPPPGFLSMQYRMLGVGSVGEEALTTYCANIRGNIDETNLPWNLQAPRNTGVMCRVRNPVEVTGEERPSRLFSEIVSSISQEHRVWLCPVWILEKHGSPAPKHDPLHTLSLYHKPWIWEGCIPYIIMASLYPDQYGFIGRKPLQIAIARSSERGAENWKLTVNLIEQSFQRAIKGGFYDGDNWIPYSCSKQSRHDLTILQAGNLFGIVGTKASLVDIREIENRYSELYARNDPALVDPQKDPDAWEKRVMMSNLITTSYYRLLLERLLIGRPVSYLKSRENMLAEAALGLILAVDESQLSKGIFRIVFRKDAPARLGLKRKTLNYYYDESGNLMVDLENLKNTIVFWIRKLYLDRYIAKGYKPQIDIEGLEEENW